MKHLLVTNDFPPKVGGIQVYLWELWRRMDPSSYTVLSTSSHPDTAAFDAEQAARGFHIERVPAPMLLPTPELVRRIRSQARETGAELVLLDPALPLGMVGPHLGLPYGVVLHGAEVTVPGRLPGSRQALGHVLRRAQLAICAGGYPASEARRAAGPAMPPVVQVPPGVDVERFVPLSPVQRREARRRLGLPVDGPLVVSVSRLVPRKGIDVLIEATGALLGSFPDLTVAVGGTGRDRRRLEERATGKRVRFLGHVPDADLAPLVGSADIFAMLCRNRWAGLEQEGFGIVFLEAAACGVPQVAGRSGGAQEAVVDGTTGVVVGEPRLPEAAAAALRRLLADDRLRERMGEDGRRRAVASFAYDHLASRLAAALQDVPG